EPEDGDVVAEPGEFAGAQDFDEADDGEVADDEGDDEADGEVGDVHLQGDARLLGLDEVFDGEDDGSTDGGYAEEEGEAGGIVVIQAHAGADGDGGAAAGDAGQDGDGLGKADEHNVAPVHGLHGFAFGRAVVHEDEEEGGVAKAAGDDCHVAGQTGDHGLDPKADEDEGNGADGDLGDDSALPAGDEADEVFPVVDDDGEQGASVENDCHDEALFGFEAEEVLQHSKVSGGADGQKLGDALHHREQDDLKEAGLHLNSGPEGRR
ncbi:MAG: hypothetical protein ACI8W8_000386, partial [Rhodothermales bacterium]